MLASSHRFTLDIFTKKIKINIVITWFQGVRKAKNIKVTSVLGGVWKLQAPAAFGIFKFLQVESISPLFFFTGPREPWGPVYGS